MACLSAVRWLCQVTVSGLLLSGCMLSAEPEDDGARWARERPEGVDFGASLKPESLTGVRSPTAPEPSTKGQPAPASAPSAPHELADEEVEDAVDEEEGVDTPYDVDARPTPKTDPQPEPQIPVIHLP